MADVPRPPKPGWNTLGLSVGFYVVLFGGLLYLTVRLTWPGRSQMVPNPTTQVTNPSETPSPNPRTLHIATAEEIAKELSKLKGTKWGAEDRTASSASLVRVIFRESGFSDDAKRSIHNTIDSYYRLLVDLGLEPPRDLPPIGLVPGSHQFWNATFGSASALNGGMSIGADSIYDDAAMVYGMWTFENLLGFDSDLHVWTIPLSYFGCVFLHKDAVPTWVPEKRWTTALLDVRRKCGSYFTDQSMSMAIQIRREPTSGRRDELDFGLMFTMAERLVDGYRSDKPACALEILKRHGLVKP